MFSPLLKSSVLALALLAVATPNSLIAQAQVTGCCSDVLDPSLVTSLIATLLALLNLTSLPTNGVIGVGCSGFDVDAVVNGQCVGNTSCTTSNIYNCSLSLPALPIVNNEILSFGCELID
ncbi:hypothetical protein NM688_g4032 [Phlebia brevispora]|uniref:Uncharacterized protein n=1 Tax=Phlebia brevispora TaxID=194682 RepID=A0ACC1T498_9APHY|nr:hypothetical protein NM688_g4032 [Phlebia brevispora]